MVDTGTGLAVLGGALGSAELVVKILGPTADYMGAGLKQFTEKSVNNINHIFLHAHKKLGDKIDQPGAVPAKVLKGILQEGAFCDDRLTAEYFGGVLASSRTEVDRDDRGAAMISLISRLTTYQIRSHYIIYLTYKNIFNGFEHLVGTTEVKDEQQMSITWNDFAEAMEFGSHEDEDVLLPHIMFGLEKEGLILGGWAGGLHSRPRTEWIQAKELGFRLRPSVVGSELFLWAHGQGNIAVSAFLKQDTKVFDSTDLHMMAKASRLWSPRDG